MFIGRERELATLNKLYASDKFEFVVIYGRRRVGKTALISHFINEKKAIYFMGVESNAKQNLENFSKSIISYHTGVAAETSFLSFQAALEYVFKLSEKERIILAIDEYPYVARSSKSLASTIQLLIDQFIHLIHQALKMPRQQANLIPAFQQLQIQLHPQVVRAHVFHRRSQLIEPPQHPVDRSQRRQHQQQGKRQHRQQQHRAAEAQGLGNPVKVRIID